ncbi:hypothetical protein PN36_35095 [Candidatus Thiomargarita nelsonii]|uniref:Bacterial sugar transferase domain-containing protein n=1 Tax=Candidatus Thiomargarita nelsonii TaxID=1003181 RepID=A0A4E0RKL7_9GAMM|nr:hypothetical protein PN36_35095 [Candidatus Thiomargarita nelsonii]
MRMWIQLFFKKNTLFVDAFSIGISGIIAYVAYFDFQSWGVASYYHLAIVFGIFLSVIIFPWFGVNLRYRQRIFLSVSKLILAWLTVVAVMIIVAFSLKISVVFSRIWIVSWTFFGAIMLLLMRVIVHHGLYYVIAKRSQYLSKIVVVGGPSLARKLLKNIKTSEPYVSVKVMAFFDHGVQDLKCIPEKYSIETLSTFVEENKIDEVWVTSQNIESSQLEIILHQLRLKLVTVRFVANLLSFRLINASITHKYGLPIITISESPMRSGINRFLKGVEDRLLASLILILICPLILIIAIITKLTSPGPVFFLQERVGWNGKAFMMLKFRSMPINVEKNSGPVWAKKGEDRATSFGRFLRKTSLDELPQFLNVLKGEMSIVGPRPERPFFVEKFKHEIPNYMQKHLVKGGITGWAQINGWRGNTDLHQRIEHDIFYIENWSVQFDIQIIVITIFRSFFDKNAC